MGNSRALVGKVVSGSRRAAYFTQLGWVQEQCMEKLGFRPYPGTLNLEVPEEGLASIGALQKEKGIELIPEDSKFCTARAMPVRIGSVRGAIIIPAEDVRIHGNTIIEVMAPLRLKDALHVEDGDSVTVTLEGIWG